jgi:hypothetical protein
MITSQTIGKIAAALVQAQAEMENASKSSKNPFYKSTYADLNAIREVTLPALNKHKIVALQPTVVIDGKKYVQTTLMHESGEFISGITEILSVKENDAQAQGSGISYARRYGLQAILNVGAEDDDGNAASGNNPKPKNARDFTFMMQTPEQEKALAYIKTELKKQSDWMKDWKGVLKKICGVDSVKELDALPMESLNDITKLLLTTYKVED